MEKPEDVPQAIWDRADRVLTGNGWNPLRTVAIAKAIFSAVEEERRDAADKIEAMADALYEKADAEGVDGRDSAFAAWVTQNIAAAIRNHKGA